MSGKWVIVIIIVVGVLALVLQGKSDGSPFSFNPSFSNSNRHESVTSSPDRNNDGIIDSRERERALRNIENDARDLEELIQEAVATQNASIYRNKVVLKTGHAKEDEYRDEYVLLEADRDNTENITITGWRLKSLISGRGVTIGRGALVPIGNDRIEQLTPIVLEPGMEAIVATRALPGFTSFRTNICTGYWADQLPLQPRLSRDCPLLEDEFLPDFGISFSNFEEEDDYDACIDALEDVRRCQHESPRLNFEEEDAEDLCRDFIRDYSTYSSCVNLHQHDVVFLGDEWRIFLGGSKELWRNEREVIQLTDQVGRTVDLIEY